MMEKQKTEQLLEVEIDLNDKVLIQDIAQKIDEGGIVI